MRAQTALGVASDIFDDLDDNKVVELLDKLITALQNQVNSPSEQIQLEVGKSRGAVREALESSRFNEYPPSLYAVLEGMEVEHLLGNRLKASLEEAFVGNDITPASALSDIKKLRDKVEALKATSERYVEDSEYFEIYIDDLEPNEYEIAITIPRSFVNNELDDFGKELVKLDKLFSVFVEIETGSREDFKIRSISFERSHRSPEFCARGRANGGHIN